MLIDSKSSVDVLGDQEVTRDCYQSSLEMRKEELAAVAIPHPGAHNLYVLILDPKIEADN